jgi:hypothetical protein
MESSEGRSMIVDNLKVNERELRRRRNLNLFAGVFSDRYWLMILENLQIVRNESST